MALRTPYTSVAVKAQVSQDTWASPTSSDTFPCAGVRPNFESVTAENPEYLGSVDKPGAFLLGERVSVDLQIPIRPPGGSVPPAAGAHIPGRFLVAAGWTESIISTAIPASPEAIASGTTTGGTLGAGATGTADLYKGLPIILSDNGTGYNRQLTAIKNYTAGKVATFPETLGGAPAANYQIPKCLAYLSGAAGSPNPLSIQIWYESVRYDLINMTVSALKFTFPVSTRNATEFPMMEVTVEGDVYGWADEAAPAVSPLGAIPTFKDGDFWLSNKALGGSSFTVDMGIQVGYPPNANKAAGNDAPQITQTNRSAQITLNHNLKSVIDLRALATAQAYHSLWAQYGSALGAMVGLLIPKGRLNFPNVDNGGEFVTQTIDMLIDDSSKAISLYFPY